MCGRYGWSGSDIESFGEAGSVSCGASMLGRDGMAGMGVGVRKIR